MNFIQKVFGLDVSELLEITFVLVVLYLVLSRAQGFSAVVRSLSGAYVSSLKALQGR